MDPQKVTIIVAIITGFFSGGVWTFIQFIIQRKDDKEAKLDKIIESVDALDKKVDEQEARRNRERILAFNTECMRQQKHTEEDFIEIMHVITSYNSYCTEHPKFPNKRAEVATKNIVRIYEECMKDYTF